MWSPERRLEMKRQHDVLFLLVQVGQASIPEIAVTLKRPKTKTKLIVDELLNHGSIRGDHIQGTDGKWTRYFFVNQAPYVLDYIDNLHKYFK